MIPGGYEIKVSTHSLPQRVASGFNKAFEGFTGATYECIAYLGSKVVHGINHALLCKQTLTLEKDVNSLVLVILNEKPGDVKGEHFAVVDIQTLLSDGGGQLVGGYQINPITDIPENIKKVFDDHFNGFLGASNTPFALVATQVVNGMAYVFAVESTMSVAPGAISTEGNTTISLVKVFSNYKQIITLAEVITGASKTENEQPKLGYAFTWLTSNETMWP